MLRIDDFFSFISERERIRLHRKAGSPAPWTQDKILSTYKFTNVRRHHDRTSAELIEEFYEPHSGDSRGDILINAATFRYFGTTEFARAVGWQQFCNYDFERVKCIARERLEQGKRVFTGAYVITNQGIADRKENVVVDYFLRGLHRKMADVLAEAPSWEDMIRTLGSVTGFGGTGFMAKEVLLDTMYTGFWGPVNHEGFSFPRDWWTYTPCGPGARRGAARVAGWETPSDESWKKAVRNDRHAREVIEALYDAQFDHWPTVQWGTLAPHDIQFQLCEFDKYERVRLGQGRPRSRFRSG